MDKKELKPNKRMILRLCRYLNALVKMRGYGTNSCLSEDLAADLKLTPAQIRKDFSVFKITGKKKAGYNIKETIALITTILSRRNVRSAVVIGINPLGAALMTERFLVSNEINLVAAFAEREDIAQNIQYPFSVLPIDTLNIFAREHDIKYAVLAITNDKAQRTLDRIVLAGIRNILSFCPHELKVPSNTRLHCVNIAAEFDNMVFFAG